MTNQPANPQPKPPSLGFLRDVINEFRLTWRLMRDSRVPFWMKLIPPTMLIYVISPVDFVPDWFLGLGQLDDLAAIILGLRMFVEIAPPAVVHEHRMALAAEGGAVPPGQVINGSWTVIDPNDPQQPKNP